MDLPRRERGRRAAPRSSRRSPRRGRASRSACSRSRARSSTVDGDTGTGWVQVCEIQWRSDGKTTELIGDYHDEYVRTAEGWQFATRRFQLRVNGPADRAARLFG